GDGGKRRARAGGGGGRKIGARASRRKHLANRISGIALERAADLLPKQEVLLREGEAHQLLESPADGGGGVRRGALRGGLRFLAERDGQRRVGIAGGDQNGAVFGEGPRPQPMLQVARPRSNDLRRALQRFAGFARERFEQLPTQLLVR